MVDIFACAHHGLKFIIKACGIHDLHKFIVAANAVFFKFFGDLRCGHALIEGQRYRFALKLLAAKLKENLIIAKV